MGFSHYLEPGDFIFEAIKLGSFSTSELLQQSCVYLTETFRSLERQMILKLHSEIFCITALGQKDTQGDADSFSWIMVQFFVVVKGEVE